MYWIIVTYFWTPTPDVCHHYNIIPELISPKKHKNPVNSNNCYKQQNPLPWANEPRKPARKPNPNKSLTKSTSQPWKSTMRASMLIKRSWRYYVRMLSTQRKLNASIRSSISRISIKWGNMCIFLTRRRRHPMLWRSMQLLGSRGNKLPPFSKCNGY